MARQWESRESTLFSNLLFSAVLLEAGQQFGRIVAKVELLNNRDRWKIASFLPIFGPFVRHSPSL
jgi:hypothetical protein